MTGKLEDISDDNLFIVAHIHFIVIGTIHSILFHDLNEIVTSSHNNVHFLVSFAFIKLKNNAIGAQSK